MAKTKNPELEQQRKAQIIATVGRLLATGSHGSLTLARVADETGVSKGMVTYYFKSKDHLIAEAIAHYLDEQQSLVRAIISSDKPILERLADVIDVSLASRDVLEWRLRFQVEAWSFIKDAPDTQAVVRESYVRFRRECWSLFEAGMKKESMTVRDAQWVYLLLYSLMDGLALQMVVDPTIDLDDVRARTLELFQSLLTPEDR